MLKVDSFRLAPGQCWLCTSSTGPAIDTLRDIGPEGFVCGQLYICEQCVNEFDRLLGRPSVDYVTSLEERVQELEDKLDAEVARADEAEAARNALASAYETVERVTGRPPRQRSKPKPKADEAPAEQVPA